MSLPATAKWILLALAGLAIAIGVAIAAANLTSQQIGIASESVSAGDALAPSLHVQAEEKARGEEGDHAGPGEPTTAIPPAEPPTAITPEEEAPPSSEEAVETPNEGGGDDSGGHSPDGDD